MAKIIQCELYETTLPGYSAQPVRSVPPRRIMVTWLEADKGIKAGDKITLKDMPGVWWLVEHVGQEHERSDIKRGWGMTDFIGPVPKHGA